MQVESYKVDVSKFEFSERMEISSFFKELEEIPVGDKEFDQKVILLKVRHGLIETISAADLNKAVARTKEVICSRIRVTKKSENIWKIPSLTTFKERMMKTFRLNTLLA